MTSRPRNQSATAVAPRTPATMPSRAIVWRMTLLRLLVYDFGLSVQTVRALISFSHASSGACDRPTLVGGGVKLHVGHHRRDRSRPPVVNCRGRHPWPSPFHHCPARAI